MTLYFYSDESGTFDKKHSEHFVFGGLVFLSEQERNSYSRQYFTAEGCIRQSEDIPAEDEVKAGHISNRAKNKLFRSLNQVEKFGVLVKQTLLSENVFVSKRRKQRYLDWVFKMGVKTKLDALIAQKTVDAESVERLCFFVDEHNTATDSYYDLRETMEEEFRYGMHNLRYTKFYPPILPNLRKVFLKYCDSKKFALIRAADIVANKLYHMACTDNCYTAIKNRHFSIYSHP